MKPYYTPYKFQDEAVASIFKYYDAGNTGNPIVVAPTGSGKTIIIAEFCRRIKLKWPLQRVLVITDDIDIITQDVDAIQKQCPEQKIGIYSAGMKTKILHDITVAGIQSIFNHPELFTAFGIIIVDEAQSVSPATNSRYQLFFAKLKRPTIGLTATAFRTGTGYLHLSKNAFFTCIIYTISIITLQDHNPPLLCQTTTKETAITLDASQIKKQAGDYIIKELALAFDRENITTEIIKDLLQFKSSRKKWLVYAIDIDHCDHICEILNSFGIVSAAVHSRIDGDRLTIINQYKAGTYQALVSVGMLVTGTNIPIVDMIVLLCPTASPVKHVQTIGRGLRVSPGKGDCMIRDYAGNMKRNGPIDNPKIQIAGEKGTGKPIMKACENCDELVPIAVKICPKCSQPFLFNHNLTLNADTNPSISLVNWHKVTEITYKSHTGKSEIPILLVLYACGLRYFQETVPLQHRGFPRQKANRWWQRRFNTAASTPLTVDIALQIVPGLEIPESIKVDESGKYAEIVDHIFKSEQ